jgi:hypothetical protein
MTAGGRTGSKTVEVIVEIPQRLCAVANAQAPHQRRHPWVSPKRTDSTSNGARR